MTVTSAVTIEMIPKFANAPRISPHGKAKYYKFLQKTVLEIKLQFTEFSSFKIKHQYRKSL